MTLTSHGNLNLKGVIHHYGDCRALSVVLVSSEISAFSASLREVIASNEKMNCRILRRWECDQRQNLMGSSKNDWWHEVCLAVLAVFRGMLGVNGRGWPFGTVFAY